MHFTILIWQRFCVIFKDVYVISCCINKSTIKFVIESRYYFLIKKFKFAICCSHISRSDHCMHRSNSNHILNAQCYSVALLSLISQDVIVVCRHKTSCQQFKCAHIPISAIKFWDELNIYIYTYIYKNIMHHSIIDRCYA